MGDEEGAGVPPVRRFTAARRADYLAVLRRTGNARAAAEAIGMDRKHMAWRRRRDPGFDAECVDAEAAAHARLAGGSGPFDGIDDEAFEAIRRGPGGRLQIVARGKGHWSKRTEDMFLSVLARTGNISAAARAVGFSYDSACERRRRVPAFARRWEEALEDAAAALEFRLATMGSDLIGDGGDCGEKGAEAAAAVPFHPSHALAYLKWREERKAGRGRRGRPAARLPDPEQVVADIVRRVEAIRRHRAKKQGGGRGQSQ